MNTSIEATKEQITYYEDVIRKIYMYKAQKLASRQRWYQLSERNNEDERKSEEASKYLHLFQVLILSGIANISPYQKSLKIATSR